MPLPKETVTFNFSSGLDTLDDPNQLPLGRFVSLNNVVFVKNSSGEVGALKKRNGFQPLSSTLSTVSFICNYNDTIMGLGQGTIQQFSPSVSSWINHGFYQPLTLGVQSIVKNSYSNAQQDSTIASNGIGCVAYNIADGFGTCKYALFDSASGQNVSPPSILPVISTTSFALGQPKTFTLGSSFFIVYGVMGSGISQLISTQVNSNYPFNVIKTGVISNSLFFSANIGSTFISTVISALAFTANGAVFDGTIASSNLVLSYVGASPNNNINGAIVTPSFTVSSSLVAIGSFTANCISTCFDPATSTIYSSLGSGFSVSYVGTNYAFAQTFAPRTVSVSSTSTNQVGVNGLGYFGVTNITSIASGGSLQSFYEVATVYSRSQQIIGVGQRADNLVKRQVSSLGVVGSESVVLFSLGLASKPFYMNGSLYVYGTYQSNLQSTYFLITSTGAVISKFSAGNGGGYYYYGVPSVMTSGTTVAVSFLQQDLLVPTNNTLGSSGFINTVSPFYSQVGINQGNFNFTASSISARQAGSSLSINGGFLWSYDGLQSVENNFFLYPEGYGLQIPIGPASEGIGSGSTNGITTNQAFQYQLVYESMDAQGNTYNSSPNFGNTVLGSPTLGSSGYVNFIYSSSPNLGYRGSVSPVKITLYRWSQGQQIFYKLASYIPNITASASITVALSITPTLLASQYPFGLPTPSNFSPDSVFFADYTPDSAIVGNEIIYTNGNVVEDSSAPSFIAMDVWDERLWGISAEDGSVWYSKPVVADTPIEMDGNFSLFIPPNQTSQGTVQKPLCLAPLDANQIFFCKSSILFINGTGPDLTGTNSQYSEPAQIPSQVGCSNPNSIVQTPYGIMFQSDNGIWMLGRDLSVKYAGKEVEAYNSIPVTAAACVPGTSEVRFSLNNGTRLVYDLLTNQWSTFTGPVVQSGAIVQGIDTILSNTGQVYQETPGVYLDGTSPVTMGFTTGWINLAGAIQGYARAYWMDILGTFQSPHTYTVGIAYDYNPTIIQTATINPYNVVGSGSMVEQWQVPFKYDQCQSFQLTFTEISSGTAGAGLMVSGISLTYGKKKTYASNIPTKNRTGG